VKALSKEQEKEKAELVDAIRAAHTKLEDALGVFNARLVEEQGDVQEKLDALNAKLQEASEWAEGVVSEMQDYYDERSEKWQEGDDGQNYDAWKDGYEDLDFEDLKIDFPEEIGIPDCPSVADDLEALPDEPG
jgi:hypothetical protein